MAPLRLITFDVTGTLLIFRKPVMEQYATIAAKHGIRTDPTQLQSNFKRGWKELMAQHPNFGQATGLGWHEWWKQIVLQTFKGHDVQQVQLIGNELIDHFKTEKAWSVVPGTDGLLQTLKDLGLQIGVLSNFDERLYTILTNLKIINKFDFVLTSYECGFMKPDRRIFEKALALSCAGHASEALHIGDTEQLDVVGAKSAGFNAVLIGNSNTLKFPEVVENLDDVLKCIHYLNNEIK